MTCTDKFNFVVNLTTDEYFSFDDDADKHAKLDRLYDYPSATKEMYNLLKLANNVEINDFGEPYWNKTDELIILKNRDITVITHDRCGTTEVPDCYLSDELN